jgi:hypothetical protein
LNLQINVALNAAFILKLKKNKMAKPFYFF